ncbi:MAG: hypothetical protein M0D55_11765 [Elusimicrobiota bacterium]|nr:MAG: hypothetical protein M0D55_11765 [Elusimicrobiota bacterium]
MTGRRGAIRACAGALLLLAGPAAGRRRAPTPGLAGRPIRAVVIETNNVFDPGLPAESKRIYRAANTLHRTTRESVVRREVLFEPGAPYDPLLARETERNLRALSYIRRAEVTAAATADGGVDVLVRTWDSWSLEVVAGFKRVGGSTELKGGFAEHNAFGRGNDLTAVYTSAGGSPRSRWPGATASSRASTTSTSF